MVLKRWDPFTELRRLGEMEDNWPNLFRPFRFSKLFDEDWYQAPMDIYSKNGTLVVKVSVPGFKPEDVELTIEGDQLTVRGHTKEEKEVKKEDYLMNERRTSSFVRRVSLPKGLDTDKAEASYDDGVLTVTFPKSKDATAKSIKVKVKAKNGAKT